MACIPGNNCNRCGYIPCRCDDISRGTTPLPSDELVMMRQRAEAAEAEARYEHTRAVVTEDVLRNRTRQVEAAEARVRELEQYGENLCLKVMDLRDRAELWHEAARRATGRANDPGRSEVLFDLVPAELAFEWRTGRDAAIRWWSAAKRALRKRMEATP